MRLPGGAIAALAVLALAGCATGSPRDASADTPSAVSVESPGPTETPEPSSLEAPEGVVATGVFAAADGTIVGDVRMTHSNGVFRLELPELPLQDPPIRIFALSDRPVAPDECAEDEVWQVGWDPGSDGVEPYFDENWFTEDPSFFETVMIIEHVALLGEPGEPFVTRGGCTQVIAAMATLTWTMPSTRPWVAVTDAGAGPGAQGEVTVREGTPVLYETAPGDTWDAIAARFGVSGDDLDWLNPIRIGNDERGVAYAWQVLNLDPSGRGDSESRRPR